MSNWYENFHSDDCHSDSVTSAPSLSPPKINQITPEPKGANKCTPPNVSLFWDCPHIFRHVANTGSGITSTFSLRSGWFGQKVGSDWRWLELEGNLSAAGRSLSFQTQSVKILLNQSFQKINPPLNPYSYCHHINIVGQRRKYLDCHHCLLCTYTNSLSLTALATISH